MMTHWHQYHLWLKMCFCFYSTKLRWNAISDTWHISHKPSSAEACLLLVFRLQGNLPMSITHINLKHEMISVMLCHQFFSHCWGRNIIFFWYISLVYLLMLQANTLTSHCRSIKILTFSLLFWCNRQNVYMETSILLKSCKT